jgi:diphosphomevalonate decarboxylase
LFLKENQKKISSQNQKFLERIEIYLPFLKTIILQSTHKIRSPQFWNCFFSIRNGGFSDELHEFRKVLNPEMTDAYFTKASLLARLGSGSACRSVKDKW